MSERPSWDDYFMSIAKEVAARSTCLRRNVGAIIVKDRRILATGYNGPPSGISHCLPETCLRTKLNIPSGEKHELCRGLHAEQNAIIQAASHGVPINGAVIYVTHHPCSICSKMLINSGIKTFITLSDYDDPLAKEMASEAGVNIMIHKPVSVRP